MMKLLFVHDNPKLRSVNCIIHSILHTDHVHILTESDEKKVCLYDLAVIIKNTTYNANSIVFIDQYIKCADKDFKWLQQNAGIALIKFMRMLEVKSHIVLITPLKPLDIIRQHPGNLIICGSGISIAKSLYEFVDKTKEELLKLSNETFSENENLRPYILTDFSLPEDERHNWANWWGIAQLTDVHRNLFPDEFQTSYFKEKNYPGEIDSLLKQLRNFKALKLYKHNLDFCKSVEEEVLLRYYKQKKKLTVEIEKLNKQLKGTGKRNPMPDEWADFIRERESIIAENLQNKKLDKHLILKQIDDTRKSIEEGEKLLSSKQNELLSLEQFVSQAQTRKIDFTEEFKKEILSSRLRNRKYKPKLLYIDDQANDGWSEIFQLILFGESSPDFTTIADCSKNEETFYFEVKSKITDFEPDVVLLDLRLKKETGVVQDVEELSGAKILRKIKADFQGLPVMMVTASNKSWSHEQLHQLGCDAFWSKEGIDSYSNGGETLKNYKRFVKTVNWLTGNEYSFIKWLYNEIANLKLRENPYWWEIPNNIRVHKVNKYQIILILEHSILIINNYLKIKKGTTIGDTNNVNWLFPSLAIHNLGKIPELIYNTWKSDEMRDIIAVKLYKKRNSASHIVQYGSRSNAQNFTFDDFVNYSKEIIKYLTLESEPPISNFLTKSDDSNILTTSEINKNISLSQKHKKK